MGSIIKRLKPLVLIREVTGLIIVGIKVLLSSIPLHASSRSAP